MAKPADRLNPKGKKPHDPWSNMEEWGGKSWFPPEGEKHGSRTGKSTTKRSRKRKPKLASKA